MSIQIKRLDKNSQAVLTKLAEDVFDEALNPKFTADFLADERHHLIVALDDDIVVGMASAVHYVHPDKAPELWINEVGVSPSYQAQGIGKQLMNALLEHARTLNCKEAWVLTDETNTAAKKLYSSVGGKEEPERPVYFTFTLDDA